MSDSSSDSEASLDSSGYSDLSGSESESSEVKPFEWDALPLELRAMCVRKMNFKTSMKLRRASRLDKLIVESSLNKPKFDRMSLCDCGGGISVNLQIKNYSVLMHMKIKGDINDKKVESLILSLLKYTHIKNLSLWDFDKNASKLFDKMAAVGAVIPQLGLHGLSGENIQLALENFGEGVELFDFLNPSTRVLERVLRDSLLIPKLINAKHIQIEGHGQMPVNTFIQHWLQYDKELGSKLIVYLKFLEMENDEDYDPEEMEKPMFASFLETFADRVVYHNGEEKVVCIKTNCPEKHILMRVIHDIHFYETIEDQFERVYIVCQVIPAPLKKEDYETTFGRVE